MGNDGKTFVGFGFGPIQSGLFLYEAAMSGNFSRYVVAEVDAGLVAAVRGNGGRCDVNIARRNGIESVHLDGLELYNPSDSSDRAALIDAIAGSDELATCLPSVDFYDVGGGSGVARMIAEGLARRPGSAPAVIYAAENNNVAAECLWDRMSRYCGNGGLPNVQTLNTVIGKMSGTIAGGDDIAALGISPLVPGSGRAVLVEEFNRILISGIELSDYRRGIEVFVEKPDLLPFEEAKLYGHNAVHALIGYLCGLAGLKTMAEAAGRPDIMAVARRAFVEESGAALVERHGSLGDPLFTARGYGLYADDLLERMTNPYLNDLVARVCRDPKRKLGYNDRIFGTMRLAMKYGVVPENMALGAAAAVAWLLAERSGAVSCDGPAASLADLGEDGLRGLLLADWGGAAGDEADALIEATWRAAQRISRDQWR